MVPKPVPAVVAQLQWKGVVQVLVLIRLTGCLGTSLGTPTPRTRMGFVLRAASEMSPSDFVFSDLAYQASKKQKIKKHRLEWSHRLRSIQVSGTPGNNLQRPEAFAFGARLVLSVSLL